MSEPVEVAIIGAGPAGLSAALQLAREGVHVTVVEATPAVGGLCRSFELWGRKVDLGPHRFFSNDSRVNNLWFEMAGTDCHRVERVTRILYQDKLFRYPIDFKDSLAKLGPTEALRCIFSYLRQKARSGDSLARDCRSFEDWVVGRFGRRLFQIFFRNYSEKLWGLPCDRIDSDFAAQRIKGLSLGEALANALPKVTRKHTTLVDRFAYPEGGAGMIYERMADQIRRHGGRILLQRRVQRVCCEGGSVSGLELDSGERLHSRHVISTMPIDQLVRGLPDVPDEVSAGLAQLRFRNTIVVYLLLKGGTGFPDQWVYVHSPHLLTGRITNFANWGHWAAEDQDDTILALEYWANDGDLLWTRTDEDLVELAERELAQSGLCRDGTVAGGHVERIRRSYPVYECGYRELLAPVQSYLESFAGLHVIGRYGAFKYNNQDHSILMGLLAADNIIRHAGHDLWSVNTDYDQYQERAASHELDGISPPVAVANASPAWRAPAHSVDS